MAGHALEPIVAVEAYFGKGVTPLVEQEFVRRWVRTNYRKRISGAWARKLRHRGVTHVALRHEGRLADFRIEELT